MRMLEKTYREKLIKYVSNHKFKIESVFFVTLGLDFYILYINSHYKKLFCASI